MTTKVYRLRRESASYDASTLASQAAEHCGEERYRKPDDEKPVQTLWLHETIGDVEIYDFRGSDILIAEALAPDSASTLEALDEQAKPLETSIDEAVRRYFKHKQNEANTDEAISPENLDPKPLWPSRWMLIDHEDRHEHQDAIRKWLAETIQPDDAEKIINGETDESLTWLRYVVVNPSENLEGYRTSMRIAQHYYAEFDQINYQLLKLIETFSDKHFPRMSKVTALRRGLEMKRIKLREDLRVLPRRIKRNVDRILEHWEFDQLDDSTKRLQDVYSNLIADHWERKAGLSRVMTELILVAIGLFGFMNVMIVWAIFSREAATNPMLLLDEPALPLSARIIANMPMDAVIVISSGFGLAILITYIVFRRGYR